MLRLGFMDLGFGAKFRWFGVILGGFRGGFGAGIHGLGFWGEIWGVWGDFGRDLGAISGLWGFGIHRFTFGEFSTEFWSILMRERPQFGHFQPHPIDWDQPNPNPTNPNDGMSPILYFLTPSHGLGSTQPNFHQPQCQNIPEFHHSQPHPMGSDQPNPTSTIPNHRTSPIPPFLTPSRGIRPTQRNFHHPQPQDIPNSTISDPIP